MASTITCDNEHDPPAPAIALVGNLGDGSQEAYCSECLPLFAVAILSSFPEDEVRALFGWSAAPLADVTVEDDGGDVTPRRRGPKSKAEPAEVSDNGAQHEPEVATPG